jgi:hypothetical protein
MRLCCRHVRRPPAYILSKYLCAWARLPNTSASAAATSHTVGTGGWTCVVGCGPWAIPRADASLSWKGTCHVGSDRAACMLKGDPPTYRTPHSTSRSSPCLDSTQDHVRRHVQCSIWLESAVTTRASYSTVPLANLYLGTRSECVECKLSCVDVSVSLSVYSLSSQIPSVVGVTCGRSRHRALACEGRLYDF